MGSGGKQKERCAAKSVVNRAVNADFKFFLPFRDMKRSRARRPKKKEEEEEDIEHGACWCLGLG